MGTVTGLAANVTTGQTVSKGGTVFVFPGQGPRWTGTAVELLDSAPSFADQMRRCDAVFAEFVDWSLLGVLRSDPGSPNLDRADVAQPALFAVAVSLAAQWRALGIQPDAVLGHSEGEIAAAYVAGALSLRDAAKVIILRARAAETITDYASHSPEMDVLRETVRRSLSGLEPRAGDIVFISAVTGAGLDASILDGDYWFANLRQPALFEQAVRWSYEHGYRTFVESSPHPVLTAGLQESLEEFGGDHSVIGTLRHNQDGLSRFQLSAAEPD